MNLKMGSRVQMNARSCQLKNQSKSEFSISRGYAQDSANRTTTNAFEVRLMIQYLVQLLIHLELHVKCTSRYAQKDPPEVALKGALPVGLELHLFM